MTREEAIKNLEMIRIAFVEPVTKEQGKLIDDTIDMAISALSAELSEDGTLTVHVSDGSKVNRVFVKGDNIFGGLYYPDSDFEEMTVGEALKAMFPNAVIRTDDSRLIVEVLFSNEVWNEPYKAESEDKE